MKRAHYDELVTKGAILFGHCDHAAAICLLGIGDIIAEVAEDMPESDRKNGIGQGRAGKAIDKLRKSFEQAGHKYSSCYFSSAFRCASLLAEKERQILIENAVPFRDIAYICSKKMNSSRRAVINDIKKNGRTEHKGLSRKYYEGKPKPMAPIIIGVPVIAEQATEALKTLIKQVVAQGLSARSVAFYLQQAFDELDS